VFLISFIKYANNENAVLVFLFHFVFVHKSVKFVGSLIAGTFLLNKLEGKSEKNNRKNRKFNMHCSQSFRKAATTLRISRLTNCL